MILRSFVWIVLTIAIGSGFVSRLGVIHPKPLASLVASGCLAVGLGFGLSSAIFFLFSLATSPLGNAFIIGEIGSLIASIALFVYTLQHRRHLTGCAPVSPIVPDPKRRRFLPLVFFVLIVSAFSVFIGLSAKEPYGEWDAVFHWNLRAKFILLGGAHWRDVFSDLLGESNPDYPLLTPMSVVRGWRYLGYETVLVPVLVAMVFTFATAGLTCSSLAILRSRNQAFIAGLVLLGIPFLIIHGASQYADVPVGFFFLATIVLLCLKERLPESINSATVLAGTAAGLACWTKNEGFLFLVSLLTARVAAMVRSNRWASLLREMRLFAVGLAPILAVVVYFKTSIAPLGGLVDAQGLGTIHRVTDIHRYLEIFRGFKKVILSFGGNELVSPIWLLFLYLVCVGIKVEPSDKPGIITSATTVGFMLAGYVFVFLVHPADVGWNIAGSLDRLLLQLWPTAVFTYFLVACPPEEVPSIGRLL